MPRHQRLMLQKSEGGSFIRDTKSDAKRVNRTGSFIRDTKHALKNAKCRSWRLFGLRIYSIDNDNVDREEPRNANGRSSGFWDLGDCMKRVSTGYPPEQCRVIIIIICCTVLYGDYLLRPTLTSTIIVASTDGITAPRH